MYRLSILLECVDMGYKRTGRPCHDSEHYADGKTMKKLRQYLCTMAKPKGSKCVLVNMCRTCESQCEYGRRYVRLYDAAEAEKKQASRKASVQSKPSKPKEEEPTVTADVDYQRQVLEEEVKSLTAQLSEKQQEIANLERSLKLTDALVYEYREEEDALNKRVQEAEARSTELVNELAKAEVRYAELENIKDEFDRALAKERQLVAKIRDDNEELLRKTCELAAQLEAANENEREANREVSRLMEKILSLKVWILHRLYPEIAEI